MPMLILAAGGKERVQIQVRAEFGNAFWVEERRF